MQERVVIKIFEQGEWRQYLLERKSSLVMPSDASKVWYWCTPEIANPQQTFHVGCLLLALALDKVPLTNLEPIA